MALIVGSILTFLPRVTLVAPTPLTRMPCEPAPSTLISMPSAVVTATVPAPDEPAWMPRVSAVMLPLAWTVMTPLSLASMMSASTPVFGALVSPMTPTVTETALLEVVVALPAATAWTPKSAPPPEELILPEVLMVILPPARLAAAMPTAFGPVTLMASVNTPPDLPTVIAPEADRASTPLVTAVIVPPVAATSTVPAPPALTRMPSPPECTSASVVIETFPSSP